MRRSEPYFKLDDPPPAPTREELLGRVWPSVGQHDAQCFDGCGYSESFPFPHCHCAAHDGKVGCRWGTRMRLHAFERRA
jgi:hypothetical protein